MSCLATMTRRLVRRGSSAKESYSLVDDKKVKNDEKDHGVKRRKNVVKNTKKLETSGQRRERKITIMKRIKMVMHLKSCCCGCSLKTGSVIIAVLSGIGALIGLIVAIIGASAGTGALQKELVKELEKQNSLSETDLNQIKNELNSPEIQSKTAAAVFICLAIVNAFHLIVSILLVFGASAERPRLVKPWIIFAVLSVVVQSILYLVSVITSFAAGQVLGGVLTLVIVAVGITISVYFILVVNSFHTELISNNFPNKI